MLEQSTCFVPLPAATLNFVTTTPQSWLGEQFKLPTTPLYFVDLAVHQNRIIAVLYCNARPCNICNSGGPMVASTLIELDTSGFSRVDHCCWAEVCIGNLEKASDNENRRKRLRSYSVHGSNLSTSQASYRKPMRALASHLRHVCKVRARLQGNTVVLVRNADVANSYIFAQANIEAIGIFSSCISSRCSI